MTGGPLILFDGVCNLCNFFVNFVIVRDRENRFRFGSLQSAAVRELLKRYNYSSDNLSTVILVDQDQLFTQSTAVLRILKTLGGGWSLLYPFIILPKGFRDFLYNVVARHRYRLFGRKDSCMIPTPELKARFID